MSAERQTELFPDTRRSLTDVRQRAPRARRSDPETSREAAEAIAKKKWLGDQVLRVLRILARNSGRTSRELASLTGEGDRYLFSRRLPELRKQGLAKNGDKKKCSVTKHNAKTWWITTEGQNRLARRGS